MFCRAQQRDNTLDNVNPMFQSVITRNPDVYPLNMVCLRACVPVLFMVAITWLIVQIFKFMCSCALL